MDAEEVIFDNSGDREVVEYIRVVLPDSWITVFALAFSEKPVDLSNSSSFMIPANQINSIWKTEFKHN